MPGWILVAKRFSFLFTVGNNGRVLTAFMSLTCLMVLSGCSNIRQSSLELPLPILPSQAAAADGSVDGNFTKSNFAENSFEVDKTGVANDFVASDVEQGSSAESFIPANNEFQLPSRQPQARFVGVLSTAKTEEIKLTATPNKVSPAPAIAPAFNQNGIATSPVPEECKVSDACKTDGCESCACCKKKELPKLAAVDPFDPEQDSDLLAPAQTMAKTDASVETHSMLQPLTTAGATDIATVVSANTVNHAATSTDTKSAPIRLVAMAGSELAKIRRPSLSATTEPAQTNNNAQLLLPIASKAIPEFKPNLEQVVPQTVQTLEPKQIIKVSPVMGSYPETVEASPTVSTKPTIANEPMDGIVTTEANLIPVSPRVSAASFQSLRTSPIKPSIPTPEPVVEPSKPILQEMVKTITEVPAVEIAKVDPSAEPTQTVEVVDFVTDASEASEPSFSNIDPLRGAGDLPDMAQAEEEKEDYKKSNSFDPSSMIVSERNDPVPFLAKLDRSPKEFVPPKPEVTEPTSHSDLIAQQIADQNSAALLKLQELQDAIKELKAEPVTVIHEDPKLTLTNAAFCTKISGFSQFTSFAANNFSGSQKTLLYCEVENQTSKQFTGLDGSLQFETVLLGSIVIYDANGKVVQTAKFPAIKDIARRQRHDFYVYFPVQFNDLTSGDYRLELSVEDVAGNETAVLQPLMSFSVR